MSGPAAGYNTKYLQELVGDALARGCAACITECGPSDDPVDWLGHWLLRHVKEAEQAGVVQQKKTAALEQRKKELEAQAAIAASKRAAEDERKAAIAILAQMEAEPRALVQYAVELIKKHTTGTLVAAAAVTDPEEATWIPPEDPEDPAANESDDEADDAAVAAPTGEGGEEGGEPAEPPAEAEPAAEEAAAEAPKIPRPVDYSKKYLAYMAASAGREWVLAKELRRPAPPPEDAGDDYQPEPVPVTFRILDEKLPMLSIPNVAFESRFKFLGGLPKIGGYQACGVQVPPKTGQFKVIIATDTLFPEGSGQPIKEEDQDFIWFVSLALGKAYEAAEKKFQASQEGKSAAESIEALKTKIQSIVTKGDAPDVPPSEEAGEGAEEAAPATEEEAPAAPAAEGEDGEAPASGEEGAEGPDPAVDPVGAAKFEFNKVSRELATSKAAEKSAGTAASVAKKVLGAINEAVSAISGDAVRALRNASPSAPPMATFHMLRAVLVLLGKEPESLSTWVKAHKHFEKATFETLVNYDATQDRDLALWKQVRSHYKSVSDPAKLASEMPETHLGVLLLMHLKQVRKVGRRSAALRGHAATTEKLTADLEAAKENLAVAEKKKAEEEEEARKEAEEEAARAAAEAAAEGGGEGEEATAEEDE